MKKICILFILIVSVIATALLAQQKELRGVWLAWAGAAVPSKPEIAEIMEELAAHHLNIVYVDVWRFGYPYFRSEVFYNLTGLYTDPGLEAGRDVLADMIAEGHRVGLEVDAWFEAGFAACHETNNDVYDARPHWFARKKNGSINFYADGGIKYHWLSHCHSEAQQFLIALCQEVAEKYDVDGIEFDRVRYPDLDCGYDSATVTLYKSENNGAEPPVYPENSQWIRWRAGKLTEFMAMVYDSIKSVNPNVTISNAPLWYGYSQFCQDWAPWINRGYLDVIVPQMYYATKSEFIYRLDIERRKVTDQSKLYPGISTVANGVYTPKGDLIAMIEAIRARGMEGHVIWYHRNLLTHLDTLRATVYQHQVEIPYRPAHWRRPAIIINEDDSTVLKSTGWNAYTTIPGFTGGCTYSKTTDNVWIDYFADIPADAWYEIYVFNIYHWNGTTRAPFQVYHANGIENVYVNQNLPGMARWYKIGDFYLNSGNHRKVVRLTNQAVGDHPLFADAIMLLNTNRPEQYLTGIKSIKKSDKKPVDFDLGQNYPNPFNSSTTIKFSLGRAAYVTLKIYNILGAEVTTLVDGEQETGEYVANFSTDRLPSGVYFYRLQTGGIGVSKRMVLLQ